MSLSEEDKVELRKRLLKGEKASDLAREYKLDYSTVHYHKNQALKSGKGKKSKFITRKKPKFIDIPMATSNNKVAIVVTEAGQINSVLEQLWK